ncbi:MAG: uncharacterized protein QOE36_2693 [Gaiellaceae bacterium]|nr:uncharacterized protein [Gaiellaceae bacterium]
MITVSGFSVAPVKGMGLLHPEEINLEPYGVRENRRFHVIDDGGRRFGQIRCGPLVQIRPDYDESRGWLSLTFPDGSTVEGTVELGEAVETDFYGRPVPGRVVVGPWNDAVSEHIGTALRLVQPDEPGAGVDRASGGVSFLSQASCDELARRTGREVDPRRFRMLITLDGAEPHEEDTWLGREVAVGEAVALVRGTVGRCAITTQNPETGKVDFDTLREIKSYRGLDEDGEIDFGVYGKVVRPGRVRVGDEVHAVQPSLLERAG